MDSVKTDADKIIRKATVKYRLQLKCDDMKKSLFPTVKYRPSDYKYIERNVRGLALLITAEDRKSTENINIDNVRLSMKKSCKNPNEAEDERIKDLEAEDEHSEAENSIEKDSSEEEEIVDVESDQENKAEEEISNSKENNVEEKSKKVESNRTILPPSSTGRVRFLPKKFTS